MVSSTYLGKHAFEINTFMQNVWYNLLELRTGYCESPWRKEPFLTRVEGIIGLERFVEMVLELNLEEWEKVFISWRWCVRGRNRMKHTKTLNHGCKKIPIEMGLSIKRKFVGLHNCKVYGVEKCWFWPAQNQLDLSVQRMPLDLALHPYWLMIPLKVSRLFLIELPWIICPS